MEAIDQIRQVASIVDIASLYTTLKPRGRKHVGLCPFHSEKAPSFTVDSEKQLFHCFGCGVGGDVFTLVMEKENMTFPEAMNYLAERYHVPLPQKSRLSPELQKLEEKVYRANEAALAFFRQCLHRTKEGETALAYLRKRGLSGETLETLKVGYAPNSWTAQVSHLKDKGYEPGLLEKAGLALPGQKRAGHYDRFRGRVIFPIFGLTGKVVAFGGRTIIEADPKYLNSPDTPVYSKGKLLYGLNWTKEALQEAREVILVEGYTDFASLYQAGIRNLAASLGTALTPHQVALAKRFAPQQVIINYDGDPAGRNAALRAVPLCLEQAVPARVVLLPQGLDPDAYVRKFGKDSYLAQVKGSVPGLKFLVDMTIKTGRMDIPEQKSRIVRSVLAEIEKIPDALVRGDYLKQAGDWLGMDESDLRRLVEKPAAAPPKEGKDFLLNAEKRLLQIVLQNPALRAQVLAALKEEDLVGLKSQPAFRLLCDHHRTGREFAYASLSKALPAALASLINVALMETLGPGTSEEAADCLHELRVHSLEGRRNALRKEAERCQKSGDREKSLKLIAQLNDLIGEMMSLEREQHDRMPNRP
ncbi:MAG: DNA primase [Candidatus Aminicenantes bacterium RBG_16_63_16]|nr:MAG: DNA primase [Candidatus Aminicenantes bacterium RBG_16_63_16]